MLTKENLGFDIFIHEFVQWLKEDMILITYKLFQKIEDDSVISSFYETRITITLQADISI